MGEYLTPDPGQVLTFSDLRIWTRDDPPHFVPLILNTVQQRLLASLCQEQGVPLDTPWLLKGIRPNILKARQMGLSTFWLALWYLRFYNLPYSQTVVLSHRAESTNRLWQTVETWEQDCRRRIPWLNAERKLRYSNRKELTRVDGGSSILIATAGMDDVATSGLITDVHESETGLWKSGADQQVVGILGTLPSWGNLVEESTARGFTSHKDRWDEQEEKKSAYFFPFTDMPEYRLQIPDDFERTDEESKLRSVRILAGKRTEEPVSDEAVYWRRMKHQEFTVQGKPEQTTQEFPLTPQEAFFASAGAAYFPTSYLYALSEEVKEFYPPLDALELGDNGFGGRIEIWEEPQKDVEYVIGGDEAEGHNQDEKHDSSSAIGLRCDNGKMAFHYTGKPSGEHFADDLSSLSAHYNNAVLIPERTPLGGAVVNYLIKLGANLYRHALGPEGAPEHTKYGFPTGQRPKGLRDEALKTVLCQAAAVWEKYRAHPNERMRFTPLQAAEEVGAPLIYSTKVLKQLIHYANLRGKQRGGVGEHDDDVTSLGCACFYLQEWCQKYAERDWDAEEAAYAPAYGGGEYSRRGR